MPSGESTNQEEDEANHNSEQPASPDGPANLQPPGKNPGGEKKSLSASNDKEKFSKHDVRLSQADGTVDINGVAGTYLCDGGCDRATISQAYADKLSQAGRTPWYYKTPRNATLADGTQKPIIVGDVLVELVVFY